MLNKEIKDNELNMVTGGEGAAAEWCFFIKAKGNLGQNLEINVNGFETKEAAEQDLERTAANIRNNGGEVLETKVFEEK